MIEHLVLIPLAIALTAFLTSAGMTAWVKNILIKRAVLDIPNERSSHSAPVPRGGGWALLVVLIPALAAGIFFVDGDWHHIGLIAAVALLALISWLDDRGHVSPMARLSLHIAAACLGSSCFTHDQLLFGGILPFWLDRTLMIVGWAWFINLYNFMDGIDGITSIETTFIAVGVYLVMISGYALDPFVGILTMALAGAAMGFFVHNRYPAKVFLGDVGSVPLGYLIGFCLISLAVTGHLVAALILPLYYLADSGLTITKRALRREKIWQAHRQHFYQKAAQGAGKHSKVTDMIFDTDIYLLLAALLSLLYPWASLAAAIVLVAILLRKMHKMALKPTGTL